MTEPPLKLTTSQVSLILQRAAEIDARGDTLSVEELERVAAEAGIDARATRTAIAEFTAEGMPAADPAPRVHAAPARHVPAGPPARTRKSSSPSSLRILSGGAVGLAFGFIQAISESAAFLFFGGAVLYLVLRAVQSMKRGDQLDFQLQNFALWLGTLMSTLAAGVLEADEVTAIILFIWLITSFLGGLLVRFGPREEEPEEEVPQLESGGR
ncbi:MAG: hypothetical protein OXN85_03300 [Gemmatimonadetes bacterium]|nr:hypothetical protein [Candidatus Palauibacter australiensis]